MESEQFGTESVTANLEWEQEVDDIVFYDVNVIPHVAIRFTGSTNVQLTLSYNTQYNVSVVATLCGKNTTDIIGLHYG